MTGKSQSKTVTPEYTVNFDAWRMKDLRKFTKLAVSNDLDGMCAMVDSVTTFHSGIESVDELALEQWAGLMEVVNEKLTAKFQSGKSD